MSASLVPGLLAASEAVIGLALLLVVVRLLRGPGALDRLLAAEALALGLVGLLMIEGGGGQARLYVDAALGLALFSFVGTSLLAIFLGRGEIDDG